MIGRLLKRLRQSAAAGYLGWQRDPTTGFAELRTDGLRLPILDADPTDLTDGVEWAVAGYRRARIGGVTVNLGESSGGDHPELHTIASHSDTTATGAELETLTDGSETTLHSHAGDDRGIISFGFSPQGGQTFLPS